MLTGCRKSEILSLQWKDVDLEARELKLPDSKTGPRAVPLSPAALKVLEELPRVPGSPWVIPGQKPGTHMRNLNDPWEVVRERAGIEKARLHDCRHSFASRALALGESLPAIAKLLGHSPIRTTARYAHLARESVKASRRAWPPASPGTFCGERHRQPGRCRLEPRRRPSRRVPVLARFRFVGSCFLTVSLSGEGNPPMSGIPIHGSALCAREFEHAEVAGAVDGQGALQLKDIPTAKLSERRPLHSPPRQEDRQPREGLATGKEVRGDGAAEFPCHTRLTTHTTLPRMCASWTRHEYGA